MKLKPSPTSITPSSEVDDAAFREALALSDGLFAHQVEGIAFLLARRRAILADDMGLGKTRQSIVALRHAEPEGPYLVICPASVKLNWEREIKALEPEAVCEILHGSEGGNLHTRFRGWAILNYDILGKRIAQGRLAEWICTPTSPGLPFVVFTKKGLPSLQEPRPDNANSGNNHLSSIPSLMPSLS